MLSATRERQWGLLVVFNMQGRKCEDTWKTVQTAIVIRRDMMRASVQKYGHYIRFILLHAEL